MASPAASGNFLTGVDLLGSVVDPATGTIILQTGDVANQFSEADNVESWQTTGVISRPSNPQPGTPNGACQGFIVRQSNNDVCLATRDIRSQKIAGSLQPGETCVYAAGVDGNAQARLLLKANGNAALYTSQGNTQGGASIMVQVNATSGITLSTPWGALSIGQDGIKLAWGGGSAIQLNDAGITLIGQGIALNGANVSLGANAVTPVLVGTGPTGIGSTSVKAAL